MATARKRPRPPQNEDTEAKCAFTTTYPDSKRTKIRQPIQCSPFPSLGELTHPNRTLDRPYQIQPLQTWRGMTHYRSFVREGKLESDWVAKILEIRASDENHVYVRVYWMYWPDELPSGTREGRRTIQGRQSYHGQDELIASNHMDIISVFSVAALATVNCWDENENHVQSDFYWRQTFNIRDMKLSVAQPRCKCNRPENPDESMTLCSNEECKEWLHDDCLIHEALLNTYKRFGADKPYKSAPIKEEQEEGPKRLLSPNESGAAQTAQHSIDVDPEERQTATKLAAVGNRNAVKTEHSMTRAVAFDTESKKGGCPHKSKPSGPARPYEGLFEAVLRSDVCPPVVKIRDLRKNVTREERWTEPISCLNRLGDSKAGGRSSGKATQLDDFGGQRDPVLVVP
ncbi:hypothetical protein DL764_005702 [Monosporascus ibericus]|uniref:BAH domain-containing protein n=1 Tax=Monosporascus ibericus TaxID=155417 RepID=A0A4Q4TB43_9PEZI|nr:hypothetical protein DL764_005702 [Monosporascus ibericus]